MKKKVYVRLVSDIHLEFRNKEVFISPFDKMDDIITCCILAGDIGNPNSSTYYSFLTKMKKNFDYVLVIAGNHEYYKGDDMNLINEKIYQVCLETGCIFLNQNSYKIGNLKFLGCTLWSHIPPEDMINLKNGLNDFNKIKINNHLLTVDQYNELHQDHLSWLHSELNNVTPDESVIIITHHAPSYQMIQAKYQNDKLNKGFVTNLEYMFKPPIIAWFSGHTHNSVTVTINNIECSSNCLGYPGENEREKFYRPNFKSEFISDL